MVLLSSGVELWVQVGEEKAAEFQVEKSKKDLVETTTCYIEAKIDKDIKVFYDNLVAKAENEEVIIRLSMDGQKFGGTHLSFRHAAIKRELLGKRVSKDTYQGMRFGKLLTTEDPNFNHHSADQLDDICTIKVEIIPMLIAEHKRSTEHLRCGSRLDTIIMHEEDKAAKWGVSTPPGSVVKNTALACRNVHKPLPGAMTEVIYFKYRLRFWCVIKGFLEELPRDECSDDDDDDIKIDEHRTERAANKRKAKEQRQIRLESVKPKIELNEINVDEKPPKPKPVKLKIDMTLDDA